MKKPTFCPDCREEVKPEAIKCPHCGSKIYNMRRLKMMLISSAVVIIGGTFLYWYMTQIFPNALTNSLVKSVQKMETR